MQLPRPAITPSLTSIRVRTLTGKEIELDIEMDYKVLPRDPILDEYE